MKCKRESDGRKLDHHTLQVIRQQTVKAVKSGQPVESVAAAFGVNPRTVFGWLAKFAAGGQNALLAKPIPGRPPKITGEEMRWIAQAVKENTPQQLKFEFRTSRVRSCSNAFTSGTSIVRLWFPC